MVVKATDDDEGENGRVTYHLKVGDENVQETAEFSIDENTGELRTRQTLDRESRPRYQVSFTNDKVNVPCQMLSSFIHNLMFHVRWKRRFLYILQLELTARDHGSPKWLETTTLLKILLIDENDNTPEFPQTDDTRPYHFYINENNAKEQFIGKSCFIITFE